MRDDEDDDDEDDELSSSLSGLADRIADGDSSDDVAPESTRAGESPAGMEGDTGTGASDSESGGENTTLSELAESIRQRRSVDPELADADAEGELGEWDFVSEGETGSGGAHDPKTEAVLELIGGASNVLVSGPAGTPAGQSLCSRLMTPRTDAPVNLLVITITETPGQRLSVLENYLDGPVGQTTVIDVRNYNREVNYDEYGGPVEVRSVSNPQDLRRIGIVTSKILTRWEDESGETTVCFHSLSDLLSLTDDRQRVFRFLHVLRGRVRAAGARAHYHFDPEQHQDEAVRTFQSLFDTVIQFEEDGSVSLL
jgi:hypothetical protein